VAKCDATLNDVPDDIRGFPTIKLYPAGKKDSPVEYTGDRSVEDLITFIAEKGTHGIEASLADPLQMQEHAQAAPAATPEPTEGVKEKVKKVAEKVKEAVLDEEEPIHDEL
jgi:protein disulfide-isomerase A1